MASLRRDDILDVVFSLNEAVLNQNRWEHALQRVANVFNGSFATFELFDKKTLQHAQIFDSSDLEIHHEYINYYMPLNPRIPFGLRSDTPSISHDRLFIDESEMDRHEFYADFLARFDLRYFLATKAFETNEQLGVFTIQKNATGGPPSQEDIFAINLLAPYLKKIADMQVQYGNLLSHIQDLESLLETTDEGVLFLDEFGCIKKLNAVAHDILQQDDGIKYSNNKITCSDQSTQKKLNRMLSCAINREIKEDDIQSLFIARPSGSPPYRIQMQNISENNTISAISTNTLILFIRDPNRSKSLKVIELMEGFGLTTTESKVARLISLGKTAREIALEMRVSLPTIRTHIQQVMQKMSINRQVDIARILARYY